MRLVVAVGGNALLERGERPEAELQEHHALAAVEALAPLAAEHELVVTHGNGPQVGLLAVESTRDPDLDHPFPLDVLGAQTQGMIGYFFLQAFENLVPDRSVASLVCQTLVTADDPAFADPTKFVGSVMEAEEAHAQAGRYGWTVRPDGPRWRRVVPSPEPRRIVELPTVRLLLEAGTIVVCSGGGGVPVVRGDDGRLHGVEAVIDKDLAASLMATDLDADSLVLLTDVSRGDHRIRHRPRPATRPGHRRRTPGRAVRRRVDGTQGRGRLPFRRGSRAARPASVDWPTPLTCWSGGPGTEVVAGLTGHQDGARLARSPRDDAPPAPGRPTAHPEPMATDADWASYDRAVVDVTPPRGAPFRIVPGAAGEVGSWPRELVAPVVVVTAWDPDSGRSPRRRTEDRHRRLVAELGRLGLEPLAATGRDPRAVHHEDGVAVAGLSEEDGVDLGRRHGQAAVYVWTPGRLGGGVVHRPPAPGARMAAHRRSRPTVLRPPGRRRASPRRTTTGRGREIPPTARRAPLIRHRSAVSRRHPVRRRG